MLTEAIHAQKGHSNIFNFKVAVTVFVTFSIMSRKGTLSVLFVLSFLWCDLCFWLAVRSAECNIRGLYAEFFTVF